jgi:plasmid maintenance system antidote protein VapI
VIFDTFIDNFPSPFPYPANISPRQTGGKSVYTEQIADKETIAQVVSKAFMEAGNDLGLNGCQLAKTIGLSEATISRIRRGSCMITPDTKPYEMAMMVIRIHKAVMGIMKQDVSAAKAWMNTENEELKAVPARKICDIRGLVSVLAYAETRLKNT